MCSAVDNVFEGTMFYSVPVKDVNLALVEVNEAKKNTDLLFEKTTKKKARIQLPKSYFEYYKNAPELNKKIIVKLASLGVLNNILTKKKMGEPYSLLYKKDHSFNVETLAYVPVNYERGINVIKDFAKYNEWVLKDINVRRNGEKGKYFVDIDSMAFVEKGKYFYTRVSMNTIFKGLYSLDLMIDDQTDNKSAPKLILKMRSASNITKAMSGDFYFVVIPGEPYFLIYFSGKSEVNWAIYNFLPLALLRSELLERVYTLLENINYRATSVKKPSGAK